MLETDVRHGTSQEIASFVAAETIKRRGLASTLRTVIQPRHLRGIPQDSRFDETLVSAAIFAVLVGDLNVYNTSEREAQMKAFASASSDFGLSIDDILLLLPYREVISSLL